MTPGAFILRKRSLEARFPFGWVRTYFDRERFWALEASIFGEAEAGALDIPLSPKGGEDPALLLRNALRESFLDWIESRLARAEKATAASGRVGLLFQIKTLLEYMP